LKIVFAHPEYEYGSYYYYRKLVELSGFESCTFNRIDLERDDTVYIVSPACNKLASYLRVQKDVAKNVQAKVVYWNLERPDVPTEDVSLLPGNAVHASTQSVLELPGVAAAWVSDRYQASLDRLHKHVVLGSHVGLGESPILPKRWDLCHFSYIHGRRQVISKLEQLLQVAPEGAPPDHMDRAAILATSRAILSIHQTPTPVLEVLRSAWSAAWHLPLICETVANPWPLVKDVHFKSFSLENVIGVIDFMLPALPARIDWLEEMGERRHELLCRTYNFRDCVEAGVRETFE